MSSSEAVAFQALIHARCPRSACRWRVQKRCHRMANEPLTNAATRHRKVETNAGTNTRKRTSVYSLGVTGSAAGVGTETSMIRVSIGS